MIEPVQISTKLPSSNFDSPCFIDSGIGKNASVLWALISPWYWGTFVDGVNSGTISIPPYSGIRTMWSWGGATHKVKPSPICHWTLVLHATLCSFHYLNTSPLFLEFWNYISYLCTSANTGQMTWGGAMYKLKSSPVHITQLHTPSPYQSW